MKYVYVVKTGSQHKTLLDYWFSNSYHTSKKGALQCFNNILDVNRAKEIDITDSPWNLEQFQQGEFKRADYVGEEGKYKGRIIIEKYYLNGY